MVARGFAPEPTRDRKLRRRQLGESVAAMLWRVSYPHAWWWRPFSTVLAKPSIDDYPVQMQFRRTTFIVIVASLVGVDPRLVHAGGA